MTVKKHSFHRGLLILGAVLGLLTVLLGAYETHTLKPEIGEASAKMFRVGLRYQMYHAFFALIVGGFSFIPKGAKTAIFYLVLVGVIFFSGSIYGLSTYQVTHINFGSVALITPLGGFLLIAAWVVLIINILKIKPK